MTITNLQAVNYFNAVTAMKDKRLPYKVLFAIKQNFNAFTNQIKAYEDARVALMEQFEGREREEEMFKLLNEGVEYDLKTIKNSDLEKIDENPDKYDTLTLSEVNTISFMIDDFLEKEESSGKTSKKTGKTKVAKSAKE